MRKTSIRTLIRRLDEGIRDRLCVQAWLGYAEVLFLGSGEEVLPARLPGERHPHPPYQLDTNLAEWRVENGAGTLGGIFDDRDQAKAVIASLVGRRATDWQFDDATSGLEITFEGGLRLKVAPFTEAEFQDRGAWWFSAPDGELVHVTCGGMLRLVKRNEPLPRSGRWR